MCICVYIYIHTCAIANNRFLYFRFIGMVIHLVVRILKNYDSDSSLENYGHRPCGRIDHTLIPPPPKKKKGSITPIIHWYLQ